MFHVTSTSTSTRGSAPMLDSTDNGWIFMRVRAETESKNAFPRAAGEWRRGVRVRPCVSSESARSVMSWLRAPETAAVAQSTGSGG